MSKAIYKYPLFVKDVQHLMLPKDAQILTVQTQRNTPCLWALVNIETIEKTKHEFHIVGTGWELPNEFGTLTYIATCQLNEGDLVFHVFENKLLNLK